MSSDHGIEIIDEKEGTTNRNNDQNRCEKSCYVSEMSEILEEDENDEEELFEVNTSDVALATMKEEMRDSVFSFDFENWRDDVYVDIGKCEETSMDALLWTLSHLVDPHLSLVFLIHISPEIKQIPTPLGMMALAQANPVHRQIHLAQQRRKRGEYVQKFVNVCSASKVKVEIISIESNTEAKAILDLIPILNIRKLVVGTNKRNLRSRSRVIGTAGQIIKGAPEHCEVKIICEGKEIVNLTAESFSSRPSSSSPSSVLDQGLGQVNDHPVSLSCVPWFRPRHKF